MERRLGQPRTTLASGVRVDVGGIRRGDDPVGRSSPTARSDRRRRPESDHRGARRLGRRHAACACRDQRAHATPRRAAATSTTRSTRRWSCASSASVPSRSRGSAAIDYAASDPYAGALPCRDRDPARPERADRRDRPARGLAGAPLPVPRDRELAHASIAVAAVSGDRALRAGGARRRSAPACAAAEPRSPKRACRRCCRESFPTFSS